MADFASDPAALTLGVLVGVSSIRAAILPAHSGSERKIQHSAIGHGVPASASSSCSIRRPDSGACRARRPFPHGPAAIEFDHVWFAYKDEDWVLRDVSFRIEPGRNRRGGRPHRRREDHSDQPAAALLRHSARDRFASAGIDIREFDLVDLRRHFGVVLQDPYLFTGTLEANIRLGTESIRQDGRWSTAAEQVNLLDFVERLPEGFALAGARARQRPFHRAEAADQFRPRAGAQSALSDSGRSHLQRRHGNRIPRARRAGTHGGRAGRPSSSRTAYRPFSAPTAFS